MFLPVGKSTRSPFLMEDFYMAGFGESQKEITRGVQIAAAMDPLLWVSMVTLFGGTDKAQNAAPSGETATRDAATVLKPHPLMLTT